MLIIMSDHTIVKNVVLDQIVTIHSPSNYMRKTSQHKLSVTASQFSVLLM